MKTSQYFPKPYEPFGGDINVKLDWMSNYVKKRRKKNRYQKYFACWYFRFCAFKSNLASLKTEVDKLDIKVVPVPVDLCKLM